jgi:hypothetical protein
MFRLSGVHFAFDKSALTKAGKDTSGGNTITIMPARKAVGDIVSPEARRPTVCIQRHISSVTAIAERYRKGGIPDPRRGLGKASRT